MQDWLANRWLVAHEPNEQEIADLFAVVDRDLEDAAVPRLSNEWRLGITYNAALQLATLALAAEGTAPLASGRTNALFYRCAKRSELTRSVCCCWMRYDASVTRSTMNTRAPLRRRKRKRFTQC